MPLPLNDMRQFFVYILASRKNGTLYTGVTGDLLRRTFEHREGFSPEFTKRHKVKRLVYFEEHTTAAAAIRREKTIKSWPRQWKIELIERENAEWFELYRRLNR